MSDWVKQIIKEDPTWLEFHRKLDNGVVAKIFRSSLGTFRGVFVNKYGERAIVGVLSANSLEIAKEEMNRLIQAHFSLKEDV